MLKFAGCCWRGGIMLAVLMFALGTADALAHRPYLVKQGELTHDNGGRFIKEIKYGDGIFNADPRRLQIRRADGALIAWSVT